MLLKGETLRLLHQLGVFELRHQVETRLLSFFPSFKTKVGRYQRDVKSDPNILKSIVNIRFQD